MITSVLMVRIIKYSNDHKYYEHSNNNNKDNDMNIDNDNEDDGVYLIMIRIPTG